jgi:hypothetical protein
MAPSDDVRGDMSAILEECRGRNGYRGWNNFRRLAVDNPKEGFELGWGRFTEKIYDDRGVLAVDLVRLMAELSRATLVSRMSREWPHLNEAQRNAVCLCARDDDIMDLSNWLALYIDATTGIEERASILGRLTNGIHKDEFRRYAPMCVRMLGRYRNNSERNEHFDRLAEMVVSRYGLRMEDEGVVWGGD